MNTIIVILVIYGILMTWPYALAYFEKEYIRDDLVPKPYSPESWKSRYLEKQIEEANILGLIPCGTYFTSDHSSLVKGPMLLYRTGCGRAIVTLISARFLFFKLEKSEVKTRFLDGTAMITGDQAILPDITSGSDSETVYEASLSEVIARHIEKLESTEKNIDIVNNSSAFRTYEEIEVNRAERMVDSGYAHWTNQTQSTIKRTFKGVKITVKMNSQKVKEVADAAAKKRNKKAKQPSR